MKQIIALVGSNSESSTNRTLLEFIKNHFKDRAVIMIQEINEFPLFNKPDTKELPSFVKEVSDRIESADGVIISTPEYDHSVPAALLNALSWLSFNNYPFVDKPVMITGASYGTLGSSRAVSHLRQVLNAPELKASIMPSSEFLLSHSLNAFNDENILKDPNLLNQLEGIFSDFIIYMDMNKKLMNAHAQNLEIAQKYTWEEGE